MADMIVAGAGTSVVNGTYVESGTQNGKPIYSFGDYRLEWYAEASFPPGSYTYYWLLGGSYKSASNVATPDLCTTWSSFWGAGQSPMPTVTAAGGGDPPSSIHEGEATLSSLSYLRTKKNVGHGNEPVTED